MKIRLKQSLPDYPAGTVFFKHDGSKWRYDDNFPVSTSVAAYLDDHTTTSNTWECLNYSDWFERIDETPLYWEPEHGEAFWFIDSDGDIESDNHHPADNSILEIGNTFPTQEAAQARVEHLKALTRVRKYIQEQGFELGEYHGNPTPQYCEIIYSHPSESIAVTVEVNSQTSCVLPLFKCYDDAHQVIDNCTDDLKTIFGVES